MLYVHPGSIHGPTRVDLGSLQGKSRVPPWLSRVHSKSILGPYPVYLFLFSCKQHNKIHLIFYKHWNHCFYPIYDNWLIIS